MSKPTFPWTISTYTRGNNDREEALFFLCAMIRSAPICDRTKIDKRKWARIAFEWADTFGEVAAKRNRKPKP